MKLCLCSHPDLDHPGNECVRAGCGCIAFRLDYRSPVRDGPAEAATAEEGDAA